MSSKLSIIMPVYNVESYLSRSIQSVLEQTYTNFELIIINDGSIDTSGAICDQFALLDHRIKVIHKKNGGLPSTRNVGLNYITGQFVTFIDSDDWIEKYTYQKFMDIMEEDSSIDICIGGHVCECFNETIRTKYNNMVKEKFSKKEALKQMLLGDKFGWSLCDKIYKRSLFDGIKCNEKIILGEDLSTNWLLFRKAQLICSAPINGYHYCRRKDSIVVKNSLNHLLTFLGFLNQLRISADSCDLKNLITEIFIGKYIDCAMQGLVEENNTYNPVLDKYRNIILRDILGNIRDFNLKSADRKKLDILLLPYLQCKQLFEKEKQIIDGFIKNINRLSTCLYIYGNKSIAKEFIGSLEEQKLIYQALVISDGYIKCNEISPNKKIYHLSEIEADKANIGIIVALNKKSSEKVCNDLKSRGYNNVYSVAGLNTKLLCNCE